MSGRRCGHEKDLMKKYIQHLFLDSLNIDNPGDVLGMGVFRNCLNRIFRDAESDEVCVGILLRVNCLGGSISGMEEAYRLLEKCSDRNIPIVVSISDHALSGGLFVSLRGDRIFALGNSLIGAAGASFVQHRDGDSAKILTTAPYKDIYLGDRPPEDLEEAAIVRLLKDVHDDFINRIATRRPKAVDILDDIALGLVYTGRQAKTNGLVDELGGFEEAYEYLKSVVGDVALRGIGTGERELAW
jgi:protease IV